jgi:hypothetical protein
VTTENVEELDVPLIETPSPEAQAEPKVTNEELLALRRAAEDAQKAREAAERRAQDAESRLTQESAGRASEATQRISAQESAVTNAIAAKTAEAERLADQAATLMEEGKFREAAQLSQKGGALQAEIAQLEGFKGRLADERARTEEAAKSPATEADPLERLSPRSRDWAREHPEFFPNGQPTRKALAAHYAALADDIQPDTDKYFDFINRHLGLVQDAAAEPSPAAQVTKPRATAAPVSRSVPDPQGGGNRSIRLTAEQQEVARMTFPKVAPSDAYKLYAANLDELRREGRIS